MSTKGKTETAVDRATHTITFTRAFAAPREQVFEAWTRPEQLAEWWDPDGARLRACEVDLRPGGAFRFVNAGHGPPFTGEYVAIEPPARLVFHAMGAVGTVLLGAEGGGTRMTVTIRCASADHLAQFLAMGVDAGTSRTLDNLVAFVGRRAA
jgi:uncharacterized protein YndB with AHSA1/START domain